MSDEHEQILRRGVKAWNEWRRRNPHITPDLSFADLSGENCDGADFRSTNFSGADLSGDESNFNNADFRRASLSFVDLLDSNCVESDFRSAFFDHAKLDELDCSSANFRGAEFHSCSMSDAYFFGADCRSADFDFSDLTAANFEQADLRDANLTGTKMVRTRFKGANLTGARVYGVTPWDTVLDDAIQKNLIITPEGMPRVTVDDLDIAQFMYLLIDNRSLRRVIDTLTSRVVLVLGKFNRARQDHLELLQSKIRARGLVPLSFDLAKAKRPETLETAKLLARLARFVIADLTGAPELPQLFEAFVPEVATPVLPIDSNQRSRKVQFESAWKYPWYLEPVRYENTAQLAKLLSASWFNRAEKKLSELRAMRVASGP